jgi:hypothetical protein
MKADKADTDMIAALGLAIATARDLVDEIGDLSGDLDGELGRTTDLDAVIRILSVKKAKVDVLRRLAHEIRVQLRVGADGKPGVPLPESLKGDFVSLMGSLSDLIRKESRLEKLISGRGLPIAGGRGR